MIHTYKSASGKTTISVTHRESDSVAYIILPVKLLESEIEMLATDFNCSIAVISGLDWNDDLSPWPAPPVTSETAGFKGEASEFNDYLVEDIIPRVETILGNGQPPVRSLVGVSLSGLFAVWQWAHDDSFTNIASLSGSMWYEGFTDWVRATFSNPRLAARKRGKAFFSIGSREGDSGPERFSTVREDTTEVIETLRENNIDAELTVYQGGHHSPLLPRIRQALEKLLCKE